MSDRAAYWQRLLTEWERSGLSQAEFCRRRRVKAVTFAWWKRRLKGTSAGGRKRRRPLAKVAPDGGRVGFVELALPDQRVSSGSPHGMPTNSSAYEIVLPGGTLLRLPGDFDAERVAQLVQAVAATGVGGHLAGSGEDLAGLAEHRAASGEDLAGLAEPRAGSGGCSAC